MWALLFSVNVLSTYNPSQGSSHLSCTTPTHGSLSICRKRLIEQARAGSQITFFLSISSRISFDNTGAPYDVTRIINPNLRVNTESYRFYSPLFLSTTFAVAYGLSFASITATVTHAFLYFRKQLWIQAKRSLNEQPDIHARLMSRYPQVPEWWYGVVFGAYYVIIKTTRLIVVVVTMFGFGVVAIEVWHTDFPVWAFLVALVSTFPFLGRNIR